MARLRKLTDRVRSPSAPIWHHPTQLRLRDPITDTAMTLPGGELRSYAAYSKSSICPIPKLIVPGSALLTEETSNGLTIST
jgi:hypothetical protein